MQTNEASVVYVYTSYTPAQKRACQKYRQREDIKEKLRLYMRDYREKQTQKLLAERGGTPSPKKS